MRKRLKTLLTSNFNTKIAFKSKKLNSCFKIKDTINFEHKHDLFIMESVLVITVTMVTFVKHVHAFQKG